MSLIRETCLDKVTNNPLPTTQVSSMEVCTMIYAKKLQIDDIESYFKPGFENTKTYNTVFDQTSDTDRYESICRKHPNNSNSYPICALEYGLGFSTNSNDASKCIAFQCPPGFTSDKKGCVKPNTIPGKKSKTEFCEERWYDWFTIPNYHLGNKYVKLENECYKPCNPGSIPSFGTDPVDGYSPGLGITDRPEMCANKDIYLGGKYNSPQNYCPIAVIKRLSSTRDSLIKDYENAINNKYTETNQIIDENIKKNIIDKVVKQEVEDTINTIHSTLEDVYPLSQNDIVACRTLINDQRVGEAYSICKNINDNSDYYLTKLREDGVSIPTAELKVKLLKKACHSLFCNLNDNPISSVSNPVYIGVDGTETIIEPDKTFCFPDIANDKQIQALVESHNKSGVTKVNIGSSNTSAPTKSYVDIYKDAKAPIYSDITDKMILSIKIIPIIIAFVVLIYILYVFFVSTEIGQWILKKLKEIVFKIWSFLSCLSVTKTETTTN
uniref:Uncharacterized protein n=1 Tax=viral metagenome TaxID=1070528 RepID=A0A6C0CSG0_9ZZZZ